MISILIPVFNFDVTALVDELAQQCVHSGHPWEIICLDDDSAPEFKGINRALHNRPGIRYEELPENAGRAAIRNRLADMAFFPYLLFMDCDSAVVRGDYIARYLTHLDPGTVLYGGRVYAPFPPEDKRYLLHWKFGREREQVPTQKRAAQPYHAFMTNNFLVPQTVFQSIRFEDRLRHYGHEDTLFGMELQRRGVPILHVDNPLEHKGLEIAEAFLQKTAQAVQNLAWLRREGLPVQTRLLDFRNAIEKWRLLPIVRLALRVASPWMQKNLLSARPSLKMLDGWKLKLFLEDV